MPTNPGAKHPIETEAVQSDIAAIAAYLQRHLGQRATAYLSGLKDAKTVGQWAAGKVRPRDAASLRLRHGYHATRMISEAFGDDAAKAWLFGTNRSLGDVAPASVLRTGEQPPDVAPVVRAARGFAEAGRRSREPATSADAADVASRVQALERSQEQLFHRVEELIERLERSGAVAEEAAR